MLKINTVSVDSLNSNLMRLDVFMPIDRWDSEAQEVSDSSKVTQMVGGDSKPSLFGVQWPWNQNTQPSPCEIWHSSFTFSFSFKLQVSEHLCTYKREPRDSLEAPQKHGYFNPAQLSALAWASW